MNAATEAKTLRELVDGMAARDSERPYLLSPETGRTITFRNLREQSLLLSARLQAAGAQPGDKIAFLLGNGLFTAQLFLGAIYGGFVAVPLNPKSGAAQLAFTLDHCEARLVFVEEAARALIDQALLTTSRPFQILSANTDTDAALDPASGSPAPALECSPQPGDDALLIYTSGSTGQPKAAVHTHQSLLAGALNSVASQRLISEDRSLLVLPLYHSNAQCVTLIPTLASGGSVVVPHDFSVSRFWDWMADFGCTWSALVPTIISQLLVWKDPRDGEREASRQRIRFLRSSSAALAPAQQREFTDKFEIPLIQAMGTTEAGVIFSNPAPPGVNKIGSPGMAWGFETKVVGPAGEELPDGQPGDLFVRGPAQMRGYYKDTAATAAVLGTDGWLRTGDIVHRDADGYFFVVGRSRELIIKGGVNIAPRQIDEIIESHPSVLEAAVVGMPDRYLGEEIIGFVVLRDGGQATEKELLEFCEGHLGHFKTPARIHFLTELPKGPSGKVQRLKLLESQPAAPTTPQPSTEPGTQQETSRGEDASSAASIEKVIAAAWAEVLQLSAIDVHANFFALNGSSLLAIRCLSLLRDKLPAPLSLSDFFEHPTISGQTALVISRGGPSAAQGSQDPVTSGNTSSLSPVPSRDRSLPCPLSPAQERVWFLGQINPDEPVYNATDAVRLLGPLDSMLFTEALNVIVARHETLRTTIRAVEGRPEALVREAWPIQINLADLRSLAPAEQKSELDRLMEQEPRRMFQLEREAGIRVTLIQTAPEEHVLILVMHLLFCDRLSLGVLWRELGVVYGALLAGESYSLPPLPIQYGDYAAWQKERLRNGSYETDLAFWKNYLRGAPALLDLPSDRPRPPVASYRGTKKRFEFNASLSEKLRQLGRHEQASLFNLLAAALGALFSRYTGQEEVILGIPIADRDRPELQPLIGFFIETHAMRTSFAGNPTFRDLLGRVQHELLNVVSHCAVPFEQVVEALRPDRNLGHSPIFQVFLNWRDRDSQFHLLGLPKLSVEPLLVSTGTSKYDLSLILSDDGTRVSVEVEYSTDLFDLARVEEMIGHYETLLDAAASHPGRPVAEQPILTPAERERILVGWNNTAVDYPLDKCLHQWIEEQVERTPDAVAVVFENDSLTYRDLNRRANQLARHLLALGVGVESLTAICVERSLEMVVGLLAVLKAGGAYVPLDPEYPKDRLAFMLEDADARVLLTQDRLVGTLPPSGAAIVRLDTDWPVIAAGNAAPLEGGAGPSNAAYMIYTSGSTGRPKGAVNTHRGIVNRLLWMQDAYRLTAADTVLQKTPFSFDVSVWEFFWPLMTGARLVVARPGGHRDTAYLTRLIAAERITTLHFVPSMLQIFLNQENPDASRASLKRVICSGEALPAELERKFYSSMGAELHNLYGPTEASVDVTFWACARDSRSSTVPIGRPIANTQIYILDVHLQPVPAGVPGELHIGGVGLARGYHRRPDLTREKFIPDPFRPEAGGRLYKTGDLARHRKDGVIEYLSRIDHQVKIRGFRIELGEIESALGHHPSVRENVVMAREDSPGDQRLVAYFVPAQSAGAPSTAELKDFLSQRLPDHMVPAAFVPLEKLPLTPNGKVDRKALPAPDYQAAAASAGYEPARDPVEETLVEIWQEVLSADRVGVHDNFFDLGGHSLLAAQVVARIHRTFDLEIPLRTLFEFPTIAGLAAQITTLKEASGAGDDDLLEQLLGELENLTDEQVEQIKTAKFKSQE